MEYLFIFTGLTCVPFFTMIKDVTGRHEFTCKEIQSVCYFTELSSLVEDCSMDWIQSNVQNSSSFQNINHTLQALRCQKGNWNATISLTGLSTCAGEFKKNETNEDIQRMSNNINESFPAEETKCGVCLTKIFDWKAIKTCDVFTDNIALLNVTDNNVNESRLCNATNNCEPLKVHILIVSNTNMNTTRQCSPMAEYHDLIMGEINVKWGCIMIIDFKSKFSISYSLLDYNHTLFLTSEFHFSLILYINTSHFLNNQSFNGSDGSRERDVITKLYIVCRFTSIASLVIILVIHLSIRELRNLHGKCLMCFTFILATAQFLVVIQSLFELPSKLCRWFAILLHYSCFAEFTWLSVLGYDFARRLNIRNLARVLSKNDTRTFTKYSMFAWILPAVSVFTCIMLDVFNEWKLLKYGFNERLSMCWIEEGYANLYAFLIPCGSLFMINFAFLFVVIYGIESVNRDTKILRKSRKYSRKCFIYMKISLMLGVTRITVYLAPILRIDWLYILDAILNGSIGLFLLVAILCGRAKIFRR